MPKQYRLPYTLLDPCEDTEDMYLAEVPDPCLVAALGVRPLKKRCSTWRAWPRRLLSRIRNTAKTPPGIAQAGELIVAV